MCVNLLLINVLLSKISKSINQLKYWFYIYYDGRIWYFSLYTHLTFRESLWRQKDFDGWNCAWFWLFLLTSVKVGMDVGANSFWIRQCFQWGCVILCEMTNFNTFKWVWRSTAAGCASAHFPPLFTCEYPPNTESERKLSCLFPCTRCVDCACVCACETENWRGGNKWTVCVNVKKCEWWPFPRLGAVNAKRC